jgi:hypothetical protein
MATSLNKLVELREQLEANIERLKQKNRVEVIAAVREVIAEYDITELELAGRKRGPRSDKGVPRGAVKAAKAKGKPGRKPGAKPAAKAAKPAAKKKPGRKPRQAAPEAAQKTA